MGSLSLLQGILPTQESNQGILHCRQILYQLSYQGSPWYLFQSILKNCRGWNTSKFILWSQHQHDTKIRQRYHQKIKLQANIAEEFCNKELLIWAIVNSKSCFCWLYRASPPLPVKNIINPISVLTIWWCPCVESCLVLLEEGVCYDRCVLLAKLYSLCPASFRIPRPNLPVTPDVSWLPTFAFQSLIMKRTSFLGISSKRSRRSS